MRRPSRQMFVFLTVLIIFLLFYANTISVEKSKPAYLNVTNQICSVNLEDSRSYIENKSHPKIYFVTPTYPRPVQIPELTRLSHTLMHVPSLHWIVADEQQTCSQQVLNVLRLSRLPYTYLSSPIPYSYKTDGFPRGVANRLAALDWLRKHTREGILYFGDDDNTFDLRLFEEIRKTKRVGMLPVGLISSYGVSSPVVSDGKVVAFFESWPGNRMYPVDMAGFAVNIEHLPPHASMNYTIGLEEESFLQSLGIKMEHIEPLAENCSKIYVWHTQTVKYKKPKVKLNIDKLEAMPKYSAFVKLLKETVNLGIAIISPGHGAKILKNGKTYDVISGLL